MDTKRNRLVIWGGGHTDYSGNEVYALDLNTVTMLRLTDPAMPVVTGSDLVEAIGTQPNSRHTYDCLVYLPTQDKMFAFSGSPTAQVGVISSGTWLFDFPTLTWTQQSPTGSFTVSHLDSVSAYDPNSGNIYLHIGTDWPLYRYNVTANSYTLLSIATSIGANMTAIIDPVNEVMVIIGDGTQWYYSVASGSSWAQYNLASTGASAIVNAHSPGLAWDSANSQIMAWAGGNSVYYLDWTTKAWTEISAYSGGPGTAQPNGTYKHWNYSPALNAFVLVNAVDQNCFVFRRP